jgi:hypothetical protein
VKGRLMEAEVKKLVLRLFFHFWSWMGSCGGP